MDRTRDITGQLQRIDNIEAAVVYGPDETNLLIVAADLEPATLRVLAPSVRWWIRKTASWPRLFTRTLIVESLDVFPIEMLELSHRRRVLFGDDPFVDVHIDHRALRVQCERELREKLMRLREAYIEESDAVVGASRATFARIFRACLVLFSSAPPPVSEDDVIRALCQRLELDPKPFFGNDFESYYRVLSATEARIDRLIIQQKENV